MFLLHTICVTEVPPENSLTEDDILHAEKLEDFKGSITQEDAELLFQFLTVPYARQSLMMTFFAAPDRVSAISDEKVQSLLHQVLFEPGRYVEAVAASAAGAGPAAQAQSPTASGWWFSGALGRGAAQGGAAQGRRAGPQGGARDLSSVPMLQEAVGTSSSLLLNELQCAPQAFLDPLFQVLRFALASASPAPMSATTSLVFFAIRTACGVEGFAQAAALMPSARRHCEDLDRRRVVLQHMLRGGGPPPGWQRGQPIPAVASYERPSALSILNGWLAKLEAEKASLSSAGGKEGKDSRGNYGGPKEWGS